MSKKLRIAFLHPDLGIGGAERLVVDAALGLQQRGHKVSIYTSHHDPSHCFRETKDGTLNVRVFGDFIPRTIAGRLHILMAIIRNAICAISMVYQQRSEQWDVLVVDQLSSSIPLLHFTDAKILFYCHFPDLLLAKRTSFLKQIYRVPADFIEELTTGRADRILVNSKFTASTYARTFPGLMRVKRLEPKVLYPAINFSAYDANYENNCSAAVQNEIKVIRDLAKNCLLLVSINRFERKKNILLAIQCLALLKSQCDTATFSRLKLVLSGGYDPRVTENVEYFAELQVQIVAVCIYLYINICQASAKRYGLSVSNYPDMTGQVVFLPNFTDAQRSLLLSRAALSAKYLTWLRDTP
jgi:alpha-1,3/alpha-1,6-mannosyltransferase